MTAPVSLRAGVRKCARPDCQVVKKFRTGRKYCCQSCASKMGGWWIRPEVARIRAQKAGRASGIAAAARAAAKYAGMTAAEAYAAGYRNGYDKGYDSGRYRGYREGRRAS